MTTDFLSGGLAATFQQRFGSLSTEGATLGSLASKLAKPDTASQTQQAVTAAEDSVSVNDQAERAAELQEILAALTEDPTDAEAVVGALQGLKDFAATETNSQFAGSVIGKLADIADDVLGAIGDDPAALSQSFAFSFSVDFSESTRENKNFYSESQSLSVSFSITTDDTYFSGDFNFNESTKVNGRGVSYESQESVSLRLVSFDNEPATNPLLNQFAELTKSLTGVDVGAALGLEQEETATNLLTQPVVDLREVPLFKEFFEKLNNISGLTQQTSRLLEGLRESLKGLEDEPAVAA